MPAAPVPFITILAFSSDFSTKDKLLVNAAVKAKAVPCWSSWNTRQFS